MTDTKYPDTFVFVGGCERSGTTMLGAMLGCSPDVLVIPESQFLLEALRSNGKHLRYFGLKNNFRFRLWHLPETEVAHALAVGECKTSYENIAAIFKQLVGAYSMHTVGRASKCVVDHTPENVQLLPRLARAFPEARFVHLIRDGRAVYNSVKNLPWGPNTPVRAAWWWSKKLATGLAAEGLLGSQMIRRLHYEDVVSDPVSTIESVTDWLQIPYHETMSKPCGFDVPHYSAEQHGLIGAPIMPERKESWKSELDLRQVEIFESVAGDLLESLGYERVFKGVAKGPTRLARVGFAARESVISRANKSRQRRRRRQSL